VPVPVLLLQAVAPEGRMTYMPDYLDRRISSAVWGTAAAVAMMITCALPWATTPGGRQDITDDYYTLWQLSELSYSDFAVAARPLLLFMLITVVLILIAAARPAAGSYLGAGIAAALTAAYEVYIWARIESRFGQIATGAAAATVLTFSIAVLSLFIGLVWLWRERHQ
jgi:hypothetical protein